MMSEAAASAPNSGSHTGARLGFSRTLEAQMLEENGAPGTIRTSDPQIRSLMLYPAELRAHSVKAGLIAMLPEHCNHFLVALGDKSCIA